MAHLNTTPVNPNALPCVHRVLAYLGELSGKGILTGQHTKTRGMEEFHHIEKITGKQPALVGFELLSYSPNINYLDTDEECMEEVAGNYITPGLGMDCTKGHYHLLLALVLSPGRAQQGLLCRQHRL